MRVLIERYFMGTICSNVAIINVDPSNSEQCLEIIHNADYVLYRLIGTEHEIFVPSFNVIFKIDNDFMNRSNEIGKEIASLVDTAWFSYLRVFITTKECIIYMFVKKSLIDKCKFTNYCPGYELTFEKEDFKFTTQMYREMLEEMNYDSLDLEKGFFSYILEYSREYPLSFDEKAKLYLKMEEANIKFLI